MVEGFSHVNWIELNFMFTKPIYSWNGDAIVSLSVPCYFFFSIPNFRIWHTIWVWWVFGKRARTQTDTELKMWSFRKTIHYFVTVLKYHLHVIFYENSQMGTGKWQNVLQTAPYKILWTSSTNMSIENSTKALKYCKTQLFDYENRWSELWVWVYIVNHLVFIRKQTVFYLNHICDKQKCFRNSHRVTWTHRGSLWVRFQ